MEISKNYSEDFNDLLEKCLKIDKENPSYPCYIGLGNPNAKILIIGKEAGQDKKEYLHGSAESWKKKDYSECFMPQNDDKLRNYKHTWQRYQKLYELILKKLGIPTKDKKEYEITFVENVFTTELSNIPAKKSIDAKKTEGFEKQLEERKKYFFKHSFILNFPIIIIVASDRRYIETKKGEVKKLFNVNFIKEIRCGHSKIWLHYSKTNKPKILLHTRQLTNGASNQLLEKIADLVVNFIKEHSINIIVEKNCVNIDN